jgi:hypothetical protein
MLLPRVFYTLVWSRFARQERHRKVRLVAA